MPKSNFFSKLRVWTCIDHDLVYPTGGASVVVAETEDEAAGLLVEALAAKGLYGGFSLAWGEGALRRRLLSEVSALRAKGDMITVSAEEGQRRLLRGEGADSAGVVPAVVGGDSAASRDGRAAGGAARVREVRGGALAEAGGREVLREALPERGGAGEMEG